MVDCFGARYLVLIVSANWLVWNVCWLVILSNGLDAPGISQMNHFAATIVTLVKHSLVKSSLDDHTLMRSFFFAFVVF